MVNISRLSEEESKLCKDNILLPLLMNLAEKQRQEIEQSTYTLRSLFVHSSELLMDSIHEDLIRVKREMRQRNIKMIEQNSDSFQLKYIVYYRGYQSSLDLNRELVKSEFSQLLGKYVYHLTQRMDTIRKK